MTKSFPSDRRPGGRTPLLLAPLALLVSLLVALPLLALPASAHHVMELLDLTPSPLVGLLSGLAHPVLGPDHLLFLLALSLVGLRQRAPWMLGLLVCGLLGSAAGLLLPGLPGAEALVALTLVVVALVLFERLPRLLLLPAFTLHGYVLSAAVLGWSAGPVTAYLLGLLLSQGALLLVSLTLLRRAAEGSSRSLRNGLAAALLGCGTAWAWSGLVG